MRQAEGCRNGSKLTTIYPIFIFVQYDKLKPSFVNASVENKSRAYDVKRVAV